MTKASSSIRFSSTTHSSSSLAISSCFSQIPCRVCWLPSSLALWFQHHSPDKRTDQHQSHFLSESFCSTCSFTVSSKTNLGKCKLCDFGDVLLTYPATKRTESRHDVDSQVLCSCRILCATSGALAAPPRTHGALFFSLSRTDNCLRES